MVVPFILFALSGIIKASGDICLFKYENSVFRNLIWFNPKESWKNKYKPDLKTPLFPLSTTVFVIFTDWLHLHRFFDLLCIFLAMFMFPFNETSTYNKALIFLGFWITRNLSFELCFKYLFYRK